MSTNMERFKAIVERGFSQGDLTVADEVCAEKLIEHEYLSKTDVPGPQDTESADRGCEAQHQRTEAHDRGHRGNRRYGLGAQQGNGRRSALGQASDHRCHGHLSICRRKTRRTLGGARPVCPSSPDRSAAASAQTNVTRASLDNSMSTAWKRSPACGPEVERVVVRAWTGPAFEGLRDRPYASCEGQPARLKSLSGWRAAWIWTSRPQFSTPAAPE